MYGQAYDHAGNFVGPNTYAYQGADYYYKNHYQHQQQPQLQGQPYADMLGFSNPSSSAHLTTQLGMQFAGSAMQSVHDNVEKQVGKYVNLSMLKHHFDVTN
ncbi:hypothetical protein EV182_008690, partial [Spiromyces aspiralis]